MDFLRTIKNVIHGWSEETRKFLATATMGIGLLVFFSVWISSVSSRLVAIGPSAPTAPTVAVRLRPVAFAPLPDGSGAEDLAAVPPYVPSASIAQNQAQSASTLTPLQGVAETFSGFKQLFAHTPDQPSDTIEGMLRSIGARLWVIAFSVFAWAQNLLLWLGRWLYLKASMIIAV